MLHLALVLTFFICNKIHNLLTFVKQGVVSASNTNTIYENVTSACEPCPPGYYGADPQRLECYPGTPGYVFEGGTTSAKPINASTDHGYVCPAGAYCPGTTSVPELCPLGTYNPTPGMPTWKHAHHR